MHARVLVAHLGGAGRLHAVGVVVAALREVGQLRHLVHGVPAHEVAGGGHPAELLHLGAERVGLFGGRPVQLHTAPGVRAQQVPESGAVLGTPPRHVCHGSRLFEVGLQLRQWVEPPGGVCLFGDCVQVPEALVQTLPALVGHRRVQAGQRRPREAQEQVPGRPAALVLPLALVSAVELVELVVSQRVGHVEHHLGDVLCGDASPFVVLAAHGHLPADLCVQRRLLRLAQLLDDALKRVDDLQLELAHALAKALLQVETVGRREKNDHDNDFAIHIYS